MYIVEDLLYFSHSVGYFFQVFVKCMCKCLVSILSVHVFFQTVWKIHEMSGSQKVIDLSSDTDASISVVDISESDAPAAADVEVETVDLSSTSSGDGFVGGSKTTKVKGTAGPSSPAKKSPVPKKKKFDTTATTAANPKLAHMQSRRLSIGVAGADFLQSPVENPRAAPWLQGGYSSDDRGSSEESSFDQRPTKRKATKKAAPKQGKKWTRCRVTRPTQYLL